MKFSGCYHVHTEKGVFTFKLCSKRAVAMFCLLSACGYRDRRSALMAALLLLLGLWSPYVTDYDAATHDRTIPPPTDSSSAPLEYRTALFTTCISPLLKALNCIEYSFNSMTISPDNQQINWNRQTFLASTSQCSTVARSLVQGQSYWLKIPKGVEVGSDK